MSRISFILAGCAVILGAGAAYIRLAPLDPAAYHVALTGAQSTGKPNEATFDSNFPLKASVLASRLQSIALAEPRTRLLAGADLHITYVQRSALIGYPDLITVQITAIDPTHARLELWSRAKFGTSDFGVNRARLERWIAKLGA